MPKKRSALFSTVGFLIFFTLYYLKSNQTQSGAKNPHPGETGYGKKHRKSDVEEVRNDTLGFSRVFVISVPNRSDKRDAVSLAASMTGIKFNWIDGVDGDLVPEKAIPGGWSKKESTKTLGCWRAHMNAAQKIVKEQIPSALIMEDDADWDVFLKSQLVEFAHGARYLQNSKSKKTGSPYGDDWDLLWLGHCGARNREEEDQEYYVIHDDPTAVPQKLWGYPRRQPNLTPPALSGNHTRVVYRPVRGLCMFAYALSLRGAQRLLYHQSMKGKAVVSDRALQHICNDQFMGFKCFAPFPHLVGTHKAAGPTAKDSDREDTTDALGGFREKGETGQIVFSTRLNLDRLIAGRKVVQSQWPEDTMISEMAVSTELPHGRGVFVGTDMYQPFERPN